MSEREIIARPYARALLGALGDDLASAVPCLEAAVTTVVDPAIAALLANPRLGGQELAGAFVSERSVGCDAVTRLIAVLIENGRLDYLPDVARVFAALKDEKEGRARAEVITAQPLDAHHTEAMRAALTRRLGKTVDLRVTVDPSLMAGAIVRIGDTVLDGSVRGRLRALGRAIGPF